MPQQATPTVMTQRIMVNPTSRAVAVINAGPPGPKGPPGPQGEPGPEGPPGGAGDFVLRTGSTMTGALTTPDVVLPSGAINAKMGTFVTKNGSTMTGALTTPDVILPSGALEGTVVKKSGSTMTGNLTAPDIVLPSGSLNSKLTSLTGYDTYFSDQLSYFNGAGWANLGLINGWVNYGTGYQSARYRKKADIVYLQGLMTGVSRTSSLLATLPVGYRPPADLVFNTGSGDPFTSCRIDVQSTGNVVWQGGAAVYVSLSGIHFFIN